jgi:hypothetical protein
MILTLQNDCSFEAAVANVLALALRLSRSVGAQLPALDSPSTMSLRNSGI